MTMQINKELQSNLRDYILELNTGFQEVTGGSFVKLSTGEMFTKTEVQKYIQIQLEDFNLKIQESIKETVKKESDIELDQRLINNRSKKPSKKKINNRSRHENGEKFNIVYENGLEAIRNMKLNNNERLTYLSLRDYVQYPTNCIVINNHIPSMIELEPIVGLSERAIRDCLKSLDTKGLIKLVQSGHRKAIYVNPDYYTSGKELDNDTLIMFGLLECDEDKINDYIKNKI
jgi:hypothetical protein